MRKPKSPPVFKRPEPTDIWKVSIKRYSAIGYTVKVAEEGGLSASWYTFTFWGARTSAARFIKAQRRDRQHEQNAKTYTIEGEQ